MTHADLRHQLEQLEESVWQALLNGHSLRLQNDQNLVLHTGLHPDTIIPAPLDTKPNTATLRAEILAHSDELLVQYYRTHPLTEAGFERQVLALIAIHGESAFAAAYGAVPERTLFVEVGEVIAESADSPRHRYGAYCELEDEFMSEERVQFVRSWVTRGEAYEQYIGMNACRYGCAQ